MAQWILAKPTLQDEQEAMQMAQECHSAGNKPIQGGAGLGDMPYAEWLAKVEAADRGENIPEGYVPSSLFFLRNGECGRIFGVVSIRRRLTPALLNNAGNIGYSIRPCEQKKGLATVQLGLALEQCKAMGMERALVTCAKENRASAGAILSQGGAEDEEYIAEDGCVIRRFWVSTGTRIVLRKPSLADRTAAEEMIAEFHANKESMLYGSGGAGDAPYEQWLEKIRRYANPQTVPEGNVPQDVRFIVRLPDGKLIGYVALRPQLSESLAHIGGNIGYCIRPSERRKGNGCAQLGLALADLRERGVKKALLTCSEENRASAATILSQGGIETEPFVDELDIVHRRFWVPTGERLVLRKPSVADESSIMEMVDEFSAAGEEGKLYGSAGAGSIPYEQWLEKLAKRLDKASLPADRMPQRTYCSVLLPQNRFLGFIGIRPELNEKLLHVGGNIGYSIRPCERRKGYGGRQLAAALRKLGEYGVRRALVTCDADNIASATTILSQGGVEDAPYTEENGDVQRRFWIAIQNDCL